MNDFQDQTYKKIGEEKKFFFGSVFLYLFTETQLLEASY